MGPKCPIDRLTIVVSGPGGAGKGSLVRLLCARDSRLWLSRSWTTRAPRIDDAPDAYRFVTKAEFEAHAKAGRFLETNEFRGNWYGTPMPDPPAGADVLLEIDVHGGAAVRRADPKALLVFVDAPDEVALRARLIGRGETPEEADARIAEGRRERAAARRLGYHVVVNDVLERAAVEIEKLIRAARRAV